MCLINVITEGSSDTVRRQLFTHVHEETAKGRIQQTETAHADA